MAYRLVSKNLFPLSSFSLPDFWHEDEDWLTSPASRQNALSVYEDAGKVYVEASVPGVDPKNVEASFHDGYLWIRGQVREEEEDKKKKYYRRASRSFSYRVAVPGELDMTKEPEATYKHGVMTVSFVKSPKVQPKKIQIKSSGK